MEDSENDNEENYKEKNQFKKNLKKFFPTNFIIKNNFSFNKELISFFLSFSLMKNLRN